MDAREVIGDNEETLRAVLDGFRKHLWTAMPVVVAEDSPDGHIVSVQIAVQGLNVDQTGKTTKVNYPLLQDVPIHYGGGNNSVVMTHPVLKGDEGIVIFMSRNQDSWYQSGGTNNPPLDSRMHHLSDARYIPGGRSLPNKLKNVSKTAYQMRSVDGNHVVSLDPAVGVSVSTTKAVNINATDSTSITAPNQTITGTLTVKGDIILNGISVKNHVHGGIQPGPDDTAPFDAS